MYTQWGQYGVLATKNSRRQELDATFQLCSVDIGTLQCAIVSMVCWQLRVRGDKNLMQLCSVDITTLQWGHWYIAMWRSINCKVDITTLQCGHHYIAMWTALHYNVDIGTIYCECRHCNITFVQYFRFLYGSKLV